MTYQITYFAIARNGKMNLYYAIDSMEFDTRKEVRQYMKESGRDNYTIVVCCQVIAENGEDAIDFGYGLTVKQAKRDVLPRWGLK